MALSNAERQKRYRQKRQTQVSELDQLRNAIQALNIENEQLRNDLNMAVAELKQLRNDNAKILRTATEVDFTFDEPADSKPDTSPYSKEQLLKPFDVPVEYTVINQHVDGFIRRTKDLWTYSADFPNISWKSQHRVLIADGQLTLLPPVTLGEKKLASFDSWASMRDGIDSVIEMN